MKHTIITALTYKYPGAIWSLIGEDYNGLEWLPGNTIEKPTRTDILEAVRDLTEKEPMRLLREERDRRLKEVDWVTLRAYRTAQQVPTEWANYMSQLADLPLTANPTLTEMYELDLESIKWPTRPE